ncbi:MAG: GUN4 domain-containing protein [Cyanobacteria bacterium P01_D01_bin.128]
MAFDSPLPTPTLTLAIRRLDSSLSAEEIDRQVADLYPYLQSLESIGSLDYIRGKTPEGQEFRQGVYIPHLDAGQIRAVLRKLCHRLETTPQPLCLTLEHEDNILQIEAQDAAAIARYIPLAEKLVSPALVYQGWAEYYARDGELSPVAQASLDLIQQQLEIESEAAEAMVEKALGPYRSRAEKIERYREVYAQQAQYQYPLTDAAKADLRRYAESLGLTHSDTEALEQEYLQPLRDAETEKNQLKTQVTQLQNRVTQLQTPAEAPSQKEFESQLQQANRESYRDLYRQIIQSGLEISVYNQGRLEQAALDRGLSTEEVIQIEKAVSAEYFGAIESSRAGFDYSRLRQLLWQGAWKDADQETERMILQVASTDMRPINRDSILNLPIQDLLTIDQLWAWYGPDQFGFTAQRLVYNSDAIARMPSKFMQAVGWQEGFGDLLKITRRYQELRFTADAPVGHLPTWRWACTSLESNYSVAPNFVDSFFVYLDQHFPALPDGGEPSP